MPLVNDPIIGTVGSGGFRQARPSGMDQVTGAAVESIASVPGGIDGSKLYIVTFENGGIPLSDRAAQVLGVIAPEGLYRNLNMATVRLAPAQAQALLQRPGVVAIEEDQVVSLNRPEDKDAYATRRVGGGSTAPSSETLDWGVRRVWGGVDRRSSIGADALPAGISGKRVFVLDTGVSNSTGDLNLDTVLSRDFTSSPTGFYDKDGHGTHVAGTIAALANNNRGIVGVAPGAKVISWKVLNDQGSGSYSGIIAALDALIDVAGFGDVANMSLGGGLSNALNDAIRRAAADGISFAIAAGNESADVDLKSPASAGDSRNNIYVFSAHDSSRKNASFTNFDNFNLALGDSDNVAFAAPGVSIRSLRPDGSTIVYSGTSMASPHGAGILLLGGFKSIENAIAFGSETTDPMALSGFWG